MRVPMKKPSSFRSNKIVANKDDMPPLALADGNYKVDMVAKNDDLPPLALAPGNYEGDIVAVHDGMPPLALAAARYQEMSLSAIPTDTTETVSRSSKKRKEGRNSQSAEAGMTSVRKKHSARSRRKGTDNNHADGNNDHQQDTDGPSDGSPGAVLVEGRSSTQTALNEIDNIADLENEIPALIVATQLVDNDEEANLGENIVERKIQEELELEIMKQENMAVVAELIDPTKGSEGAATSLPATGTDQAVRKFLGLNQKIWCDILVVVALLLAGVVAGVVVSSKKQASESPTKSDTQEMIRQELEPWTHRSGDNFNNTPFNDATSPQSLALDWLLNDSISLSEHGVTPKVLERYALAVFYYSTGGPNWKDDSKFLSETDACSWSNGLIKRNESDSGDSQGAYCNSAQTVDVLQFIGRTLVGTVPWELSLLSNMVHLYLDGNSLMGTLPTELGGLIYLERLVVANNSLTGTLPTELVQCSSLRTLLLNNNSFTGTLPTELGKLTALQYFQVVDNDLVGTVPTELGK